MAAFQYAPHALLSPYVERLCYNERTFAPRVYIRHLAGQHDRAGVEHGRVMFGLFAERADCATPMLWVALLAEPLRIAAEGWVQVVRARVYPWCACALLGDLLQRPDAPLVPGLLTLREESFPLELNALSPSLDEGASAVEAVQRLLLQRAMATRLKHRETIQAAQTLLARRGMMTVGELAEGLGVAERSLRRQFRATLELGPKEFARLTRFEQVRDLLWRTPDAPLAEVALDARYSDQAHMQREFRRFSQRTPRQFAAEMRQLHALLGAETGRNLQEA